MHTLALLFRQDLPPGHDHTVEYLQTKIWATSVKR